MSQILTDIIEYYNNNGHLFNDQFHENNNVSYKMVIILNGPIPSWRLVSVKDKNKPTKMLTFKKFMTSYGTKHMSTFLHGYIHSYIDPSTIYNYTTQSQYEQVLSRLGLKSGYSKDGPTQRGIHAFHKRIVWECALQTGNRYMYALWTIMKDPYHTYLDADNTDVNFLHSDFIVPVYVENGVEHNLMDIPEVKQWFVDNYYRLKGSGNDVFSPFSRKMSQALRLGSIKVGRNQLVGGNDDQITDSGWGIKNKDLNLTEYDENSVLKVLSHFTANKSKHKFYLDKDNYILFWVDKEPKNALFGISSTDIFDYLSSIYTTSVVNIPDNKAHFLFVSESASRMGITDYIVDDVKNIGKKIIKFNKLVRPGFMRTPTKKDGSDPNMSLFAIAASIHPPVGQSDKRVVAKIESDIIRSVIADRPIPHHIVKKSINITLGHNTGYTQRYRAMGMINVVKNG